MKNNSIGVNDNIICFLLNKRICSVTLKYLALKFELKAEYRIWTYCFWVLKFNQVTGGWSGGVAKVMLGIDVIDVPYILNSNIAGDLLTASIILSALQF